MFTQIKETYGTLRKLFRQGDSQPVQQRVIQPCPFCGEQPKEGEFIGQIHLDSKLFKTAKCMTNGCPLNGIDFHLDAWQQRAV